MIVHKEIDYRLFKHLLQLRLGLFIVELFL